MQNNRTKEIERESAASEPDPKQSGEPGSFEWHYLKKEQNICQMINLRKAGYRSGRVHLHDHNEILLITSESKCTVRNGTEDYCVIAPALIRHKAGTVHEIVSVERGDCRSIAVFYIPDALLNIPESFLPHKEFLEKPFDSFPLTSEEEASFETLMKLLNNAEYPRKKLLLATLLSEIEATAAIKADRIGARRNTANGCVQEILIALSIQPEDNRTIREWATHYHISEGKLKQDFKEKAGMPFGAFRRMMRLQKSRMLLENTTYAESQIALEAGFADESHFIRSFRSAEGMTPGEYRKMKCTPRQELH